MLFHAVTDERGTTYLPTIWGNILLAAIILALLAAAVFFSVRQAKRQAEKEAVTLCRNARRRPAKQFVFCAMSLALGTLLSNFKLFSFPFGGSVTLLSMLVICLPGYFFGLSAGILTGTAYGILQLLIDPYILFPAQLILDYILAFGALGLSGLFSRFKNGLLTGYIAAILGRYVFVVLSGCLFFGEYAWEGWNPLPYSLVYNGAYIFAEALLTLILLALPPVKHALLRIKAAANA